MQKRVLLIFPESPQGSVKVEMPSPGLAYIAAFLTKRGITFPVLLDSDGAVANSYGVKGIPAVFVVNKDGKTVFQGHHIPENYTELVK